METEKVLPKELQKTILVAAIAFVILTCATYLSYRHTKSRTPQIILPGGVSYLGPSPSSQSSSGQKQSKTISDKIPIPDSVAWTTWKGQRYQYSFSYPSSLSLGLFPNDPFDAVTIFWGDTNPQENLLLRIEDLNSIPDMKDYINKPKRQYVEQWWKQYDYTGVASIKEITTKSGLKGFRARYTKSTGNSTFDNVFIPIPNKPNLILWTTGKFLQQSVFDRIVESITWSG